MSRKVLTVVTLLMLAVVAMPNASSARDMINSDGTKGHIYTAAANPAYCLTQHDVGKMVLAVSNYGVFGNGFAQGGSINCFTGERVFSCEYPKGTRTEYIFASCFWVGAIVGRDTLVSTGNDGWYTIPEMFPNESGFRGGDMIQRTIMDPTSEGFDLAVSEQDYIAVYTDTFTSGVPGVTTPDEVDNRPHIPLGIEITQRSYSWSYPYAEDFVLFDYSIRNIGGEHLRQVYMGVYVDGDVHQAGGDGGFDDDICGFIEAMPTSYAGCDWWDTVNIAWIADNDGELVGGTETVPVPNITATRIVRTPSDSLDVSFNWWVSNGNPSLDFGPQKKANVRDLIIHGGTGTPAGDRNKYAFMRNGEFDYDQVYTASISPDDSIWVWPNQAIADRISEGFDTRYLLSFGPFNIDPGQTLPLSFCYVGGENLHNSQTNYSQNLSGNYDPDEYYRNLDFSDLGVNSVWASWVYDNPGIDSDSSGYSGEFRLCCLDSVIDTVDQTMDPWDTIWEYLVCDSVYYMGDGVPDFRGASPPPAPVFWIEPSVGQVRVRWNGLKSENAQDVFSGEYDFEGYRVYLSRDERSTSYSLLTSYDIEDYNKWVYNSVRDEWELKDTPFSLEELVCLYGDSCGDPYFSPENYDRNHAYQMDGFPDSVFYFAAQDHNRSELGVSTPVTKVYPDQPYPSTLIPDSADASELTEDGYFKYYEYEFTIDNLLPTVYYWLNVTAFDYGSPQSGLEALETSKTINSKQLYPLNTSEDVAALGLDVFVYPNPYRIETDDQTYITRGFEGRDSEWNNPDPERERLLHFANLPAKCTISIYSLDGDLVRKLVHDMDPSDPMASHETWDMVTRNTQSVVSGLYYWTVEDPNGETQIGKFVVIK